MGARRRRGFEAFARVAGMGLMLLAGAIAFDGATTLAQDKPVTCPADTEVPDDGFESGGLGLTCVEMEERYGQGEVSQSSIFYVVDDVQVHAVRGGLSISWNRGNPDDGIDDETARDLAEQFLPEDAEETGTLNLGGVLFPVTEVHLYHSDALADRFEELGED